MGTLAIEVRLVTFFHHEIFFIHLLQTLQPAENPSTQTPWNQQIWIIVDMILVFKGSFSQRVSVPVFVGHGRWILFSGHWELLHSEVHDVLVSAVKPEEDQKVPKPVNRGGTRANTLHKLLWQAPHGEGELTAARSTAHFIIPTLFIKL